jgi:uncharacterized protein YdeI (YjbR/CyaY-like superfamily)
LIQYETLYIKNRPTWRAWLRANHAKSRGIWLKYFKKKTGKPSLRYEEALEEALCFGWIDSIIRRIDEEAYVQKFTPRAASSNWSEKNLRLVGELRGRGLMSPAGESAVAKWKPRVPDSSVAESGPVERDGGIPRFISDALARKPPALDNFGKLAPGYKRMYLKWILSARKEETRLNRAAEAADRLMRNLRLGLK